jgi:outer membrane protein, heavy metal efflux system
MASAWGDAMVRSVALIAFVLFGTLLTGRSTEAQVRFNSPSPPSGSGSPSLGSTSIASPGQTGTIFGGPPGLSVGRVQPSLLRPPAIDLGPAEAVPLPNLLPGSDAPVVRPRRPNAPESPPENDSDPKEGITLDDAVGLMINNNLDLRVSFSEISQADSDVLTASLRNNPILYADSQMIPYGAYSSGVTGGPTQYDINVVYPLDLSHKKQARTRAAIVARRFVEASYRDAVRQAVDNLYGAFVDALSAQQKYERAIGKRKDILAVVPVDEPAQGLWDAQRKLALLINLPPAEVARRGLRGRLGFRRDEENLPPLSDSVHVALENRPDIAAQRLAVCVADANIKSVLANRFDDVLLLYQPYTLKSGAPFDQRNGLAWAIGMTVPLPIYNRQQGNLLKARQIADQARTKLASIEQAVASEVQGVYLEHEAAHLACIRTLDEFTENARDQRPVRLSQELSVDASVRAKLDRLEKQLQDLRDDSLIDKLNKHYEAIIRHRKSLLHANTATGTIIVR